MCMCIFVQSVWTSSNLLCIPNATDNIENQFRQNFIDQPYDQKLMTKALLICWQIWEARNSLIFKQVQPHPSRVLIVAAAIGSSYWKENPSPHKEGLDKSYAIK